MARNDLKTITKMIAAARDEIKLPNSLIRQRLAQSHASIASEELLSDTRSAGWHYLQSLRLNPFQARVAAFYLLSLLPLRLLRTMRDIKRKLVRV